MSKAFDIVVFGATGYSGKLVVKYLIEKNEHTRIRLGIAGRSPNKLQEILKGYSVKEDQIGVLKADVSDESSIKDMCSQTNVLLNCVGPFFLYGDSVVRNCINSGTDYVDITGETNFIKTVYTKYHQLAAEKNVLVVPAVAFDSLPVELLNCYTGETFKDFVKNNKDYNQCVMNTYATIRGGGGGLSHGTYLTVLQNVSGKATSMKYSQDLSGLSATPKPGYAEDAKGWVFPWPTCDPFEVRWSQRLLKSETFKSNPVSEAFQFDKINYSQYYRVGKFIPWLTMLLGLLVFIIAARIPPIFKYLEKRMSVGQGPEKAEHGSFEFTSFTTLKGTSQVRPQKYKTKVKGKMGYWLTGQLASEAALSMLEDKKNFCVQGGVYPPGAVFYPHIMKRIDQYLTFETVNNN